LPATSTPSPPPSAAPAKPPKPTAKPAATRRYKVRSGDTLSGIASRFGTTVAALKRLNNISDASHLRTGQILRLP
jgi:LysM repeat protein